MRKHDTYFFQALKDTDFKKSIEAFSDFTKTQATKLYYVIKANKDYTYEKIYKEMVSDPILLKALNNASPAYVDWEDSIVYLRPPVRELAVILIDTVLNEVKERTERKKVVKKAKEVKPKKAQKKVEPKKKAEPKKVVKKVSKPKSKPKAKSKKK